VKEFEVSAEHIVGKAAELMGIKKARQAVEERRPALASVER